MMGVAADYQRASMMALGWAANEHPSTSSSLDSSAIFEA
jgi:hypothetical protein